MSCKNCFNGCNPVVGDKCVKYTGPSISALEIENGDNLFSVLQILLNNTLTFLSGTGIKVDVPQNKLCDFITDFLPVCVECTGYNLEDILSAMSEALCTLNVKTDATNTAIDVIDAPLVPGCLTGFTGAEGINSVLQGTINFLCALSTNVAAIELDLVTNYVKVSEVNTYIQNFIAGEDSKVKTKMVPYVVLEYYGPLTNFDGTGKGTGDWEDVYLCNGENNTPDRRGRTAVGALIGMGGGVLDSAVNPALSTQTPNYALGSKQGANSVTLLTQQIPSHTHTLEINSGGAHTHYMAVSNTALVNNSGSLYDGTDPERKERGLASRAAELSSDVFDYELGTIQGIIDAGKTSSSESHIHTGTAQASGGNQAHSNIQPSIGAYYIIYLP